MKMCCQNCFQGQSKRLGQQIEPHPNNWQYSLLNYPDLTFELRNNFTWSGSLILWLYIDFKFWLKSKWPCSRHCGGGALTMCQTMEPEVFINTPPNICQKLEDKSVMWDNFFFFNIYFWFEGSTMEDHSSFSLLV